MACLVQNTTSPSVGDSSSGSGWAPLYGGGTHLDQEAIQYIHKFYCKDCRMEAEKAKADAAAAGGDSPQGGGDATDMPTDQPISPQAMLEQMSLQQSMDKNKESLKRKLMMRRSVTELVDQGIYPPLKTPPAFAEQRKHLERAKTGDLLRHKIIHRPDRQLLVQQHILEDTKIDPSLHERQRLLKRARLADDLNEKLLHRPGPLDLIRGNILKTENEKLTEAITDGVVHLQVPDQDPKPVHFVFDDDSSEGAPSPSHTEESGMSDIGSPPVIPPAPDPPPIQLKTRQVQPAITPSVFSKMAPLTTQSITMLGTPITSFTGSLSSSSSTSKNNNSGNGINKASRQKKSKPKTSSKSKVIKFHEYKGPPSASKSQTTSTSTVTSSSPQTISAPVPATTDSTPYHVMLQQQQLFLQWQLEFQQKNLPVPVTLLPQHKMDPASVCSTGQSTAGSVIMTSAVNTAPTFVSSPPAVVQAQGVVPAQGLLPAQGVVPAQGMLPAPSVVPAQGMLPAPSVVPAQGMLPAPSVVPAQGMLPAPSVVPAQGMLPTPSLVPAQGMLPTPSVVPAQGMLPAPSMVPAQGMLPAPSVVPAQGMLPMPGVVPAQGMLPTPGVVPAQGMLPTQVATTVVSPSILHGQPVTVAHTNTVIKQQMQPQAQLQTVSQPQVHKIQQVPVHSGQNTVQKPVSQVRTHTQSQSHQSKSQGKSSHTVQKPFTNLEDMKVADLKLELKKRNLPVSGPKPQLIERLKPYIDVIIGVQHSVNTSVSNDNSLVKRPVQTIVSVKSVPLTPLDDTVSMLSPPCSPRTEQIISTIPLSPEIMDIAQTALNAQSKGGPLSLSQSSIPMAVDNSRPPSVAPMDITMDVDGPLDNLSFSPTNFSQSVTSPVSTTVVTSSQSVKQVPSPPGAAPQISSEILLQQQRRIAQLQKELEESQMRLKMQQMQHHHLQQQQQQLRHLQQQTQLLQQPTSPPQLTQQPNSPPQQVIQQLIQQPNSPPQLMQPSPQPTPPPQLIHAVTSSQPNSPPRILQQPLSPPQTIQQPISPPQVYQQPISPPQVYSQPISPPQVYHQPISPPQVYHQPISPPQVYHQPISPPQVYQQPISPPQQPRSPPQTLTTVTMVDGKVSPIPHNLPKLVPMPTHSMNSVIGNPPVLTTTRGLQLAPHGLPTLMVATSTAMDNKKQSAKPTLSEFFKAQALHQGLNLVKPVVSNAGTTFKQPTLFVTSGAKTITLTAPLNGLATTRTTSLPSSPVEGKMSLSRAMSNPFFVPQKEPPKYDDAVRIKHTQQGPGTITIEPSNGTVPNKIPVKSQAMDDVLEILIRTGELPPSAAQEPPPTPKSTTQTHTIPTCVSPAMLTMATTTPTSYTVSSSSHFPGLSTTFSAIGSSDTDDISALLNSPPHVSILSVKQESSSPPPLIMANVLSPPDTSTHDLLDINDYMFNQDLNAMEWSSDQAFNLDLNDTTPLIMQTDQEMKCDGSSDYLNVPLLQGVNKTLPHGSEPDLTGLGLTDPENCANVQMDVSDWLDVIMPSTGLTPLSSNPPVSFPSDPILTPKTQQEVLELFNFDDTDFSAHADLQSGVWDKLTESTGSS